MNPTIQSDSRTARLGAIAQVGEVIASVAVVITLIFLIVELRQNTQVAQAAAYERSMDALNQLRLALATNEDLAGLYVRDSELNGESQGSVADLRLRNVIHVQWAIYESAYYGNRRGLLGTSEWSRFERQICAAFERSGVRWNGLPDQSVVERRLLTQEFAHYVETTCRT